MRHSESNIIQSYLPVASKNSSLEDHWTHSTEALWPFKMWVEEPDLRSHRVTCGFMVPTTWSEMQT